jgi:urease accessory protein
VLGRRLYTWPYTVGRLFYPADESVAELIIQSGSGSIITGDRLRQRLGAAAGSVARVRGQGAVSVHKSGRFSGSSEELALSADAGSRLENLAEPRVLFPGAEFEQSTTIDVARGGVVISVEAVVLHTEAGAPSQYSSDLAISIEGRGVARETSRMSSAGVRAGSATAFAVIVAVGVADRSLHAAAWAEWIGSVATSDRYGSVSDLPFDAGLAVRIAAINGRELRIAIDSALVVLRRYGAA